MLPINVHIQFIYPISINKKVVYYIKCSEVNLTCMIISDKKLLPGGIYVTLVLFY